MKLFIRNRSGSSLLFVFVALGLVTTIPLYVLKINNQLSEQSSILWNRIVADETAQSSFVLLEAALARRLWSPPPDKDCMIQEEFSVNGILENGATYQVDGKYIKESKTLEMTSLATYKGVESRYQKNLKIYDVADYLILSKKTEDTTITSPRYSTTLPTSLIARERKVYFDGGVKFQNLTYRPHDYDPDKNKTYPMLNPGEINIILQAERLIFKGGLRYDHLTSPIPAPGAFPKFYNDFRHITNDYYPETTPTGPTYFWQWGGGGAFITNDFQQAKDVDERMRAGSSVNHSLIMKHFYPIALFTGMLPLNATNAQDTGSFFDDPNKWLVFTYSYGPNGVPTFGARRNFTCYTEDRGADTRFCSSSRAFPKGFDSWRKEADLKGVLFTDDFEDMQTQTITWDNMEAMKEDAKACGIYVNESTGNTSGSYSDCDLSNSRFVGDYITGKGANCSKIFRLDSESIQSKLSNFSAANYSSANDKILRRVIYSEVPLEIVQSQVAGLSTSMSSNVRENLPLWVVNEDVNILKPFQPDTTSPINERPGEFRQLYFNSSPTNLLKPLNMVYLSPERTVIHSPFHKPLSNSELLNDFPVVNGRIRPSYSIQTDWKHHEDDGLKYGVRIVNIKNMSLIDNTQSFSYHEGFFLRGLWSVVDSSAIQVLRNGCFLSPSASEPIVSSTGGPVLPPGHPALGKFVPPLSSRFYDQTSGTKISHYYRPYIFELQFKHSDVRESVINFEGTRLGVYFSAEAVAGKQPLSIQKYSRREFYNPNQIDLSQRSYVWDSENWYNKVGSVTNPISCTIEPVIRGTTVKHDAINVPLNRAEFTFLHQPPGDDFNSVGSIMSLPLPMLKMRK